MDNQNRNDMERINIDHDLHQVIEPKIQLNAQIVGRLRFQRFLAEQGKFDNKPLSVPRGDVLLMLPSEEIKKYAMQEADKKGMALAQPQSQYEQQH